MASSFLDPGTTAAAATAQENSDLLQKLTRSEEQLRLALEAGKLGAWDWDIATGKVTWSAMLEQIHGLEVGTFPGTFEAYQQDIHPEDRDHVRATIGQAVGDRSDYHIVYRINRPDGEMRWLEAHGRMLCDPAGAPRRLVGVCNDITERRRSEEQLREMVLTLRDANQRKDQFLAMLAHELRNPLTPMVNATYMLRAAGEKPDSVAQAREILNRQVGYMARLLDELLDVSRISRGKIDLVRESVDLAVVTREAAGDHQDSFRAAGLALQLALPSEPIRVHADRARLAQIVGNLLSNALKFSEHGQSVFLTVERSASSSPSTSTPWAALTVRDEGVGIDPALLGRVFEPFVQAEAPLSRPRGGLGLGLAVVKGLVELHGGSVAVRSAGHGQGTELRIELPLEVGAAETVALSPPLPEVSAPRAAAILLFEDNIEVAESLHAVLSQVGYQVTIRATGRNPIEAVRHAQPALVLCDIGLPVQDGYAVAAEIRSDPDWGHLPLIALSGYGSKQDQARSRQAGFDLHLTKPVAPELLIEELSSRCR